MDSDPYTKADPHDSRRLDFLDWLLTMIDNNPFFCLVYAPTVERWREERRAIWRRMPR